MAKRPPAGVPEPGARAPDFELTSDTGATVRLSDFRGQAVIIFFYPKALTPGCTVQACAFRDARANFEAGGAVILGISPDSVERLARFREKHGLNFPLLSDPDHAVAEAYGVWREKKMFGRGFEGIVRSQFVVGPDGRIMASDYRISPKDSVPVAERALRSGAW